MWHSSLALKRRKGREEGSKQREQYKRRPAASGERAGIWGKSAVELVGI